MSGGKRAGQKLSRIARKYPWIPSLIYVAGAVVFFMLPRWLAGPPAWPVSYSEFVNEIRANHLQRAIITPTQLVGIKKPAQTKGSSFAPAIVATRLPDIDETSLLRDLEQHHVTVNGEMNTGPGIGSWILAWLPFLLMMAALGYGAWRTRQVMGPLRFGKNRTKIYDQSDQLRVTFADVAGIDEARSELQEIVDFLKHPAKYRQLGGRIPHGVLLVGPPGTGKTLLARAVAAEAAVPFFAISGSEFVEMFVGVGAARVRELFDEAKKKAPCIVFIDELDAIGKSRASGRGMIVSHDEREQTLNQLLVEMDGFDPSTNVIIMAATNTPEVLDPALLRPGRFDRQVVLERPDIDEREAILRVHAKKVRLNQKVDLRTIAARTPGMVGADLANIVNEAALLAARRGASEIDTLDMEAAIDRVMLGLEKKSRVMTPEEKERVAYHEGGHALVALSVPNADPVHRISIIPRTMGALGHTLQLPTHERYLMTRPQLEDQIAVMLGGRAAEDTVYNGVVSTGAADDLQRATELARHMVKRYGMSERLGNITYGHPLESRYLKTGFAMEERDYSEKTAEEIDEEVRRIVEESYRRVKAIVTGRREMLGRIVQRLMEKETIEENELQQIAGDASSRDSSERLVPDVYQTAYDIKDGVYAAEQPI
ncbi:MAG TPA: ATP-dependent zinc metalloprotease FtsH [Bryobacteraceae bacterium]|jgi:cell division protease FtsH|nr:ATP-dependent zinc metalloprotease FtsH [Bryobacteraceae bacterium]